jgi:hypothetical protein
MCSINLSKNENFQWEKEKAHSNGLGIIFILQHSPILPYALRKGKEIELYIINLGNYREFLSNFR